MTTALFRAAAVVLGIFIAAMPSQVANSQLLTTFVGQGAGGGTPPTPCGDGQLDFSVAGCNIIWMGG